MIGQLSYVSFWQVFHIDETLPSMKGLLTVWLSLNFVCVCVIQYCAVTAVYFPHGPVILFTSSVPPLLYFLFYSPPSLHSFPLITLSLLELGEVRPFCLYAVSSFSPSLFFSPFTVSCIQRGLWFSCLLWGSLLYKNNSTGRKASFYKLLFWNPVVTCQC